LYDDEGEYDHMEQLRCELVLDVSSAAVTPAYDTLFVPTTPGWIDLIEQMDGIPTVLAAGVTASTVSQEQV
jgi:hypothetical protein